MSEFTPILGALAGGIFPALAWLWFWRREDAPHPEPRKLIALAFFAGMCAVAIVIPIQKFVAVYLVSQTAIFTAWSAIEEIMKYFVARITVLGRREDDEPIDPIIYMVAVALGFAAVENTLFLLSPLAGETFQETVITGNLRFVGATLLHVLSSAAIGLALSLSFYKKKSQRRLYATVGVILAISLHSLFNFLILNTAEEHIMRTFGLVWLGLVGLLAVLEYVKRIHPALKNRFS